MKPMNKEQANEYMLQMLKTEYDRQMSLPESETGIDPAKKPTFDEWCGWLQKVKIDAN